MNFITVIQVVAYCVIAIVGFVTNTGTIAMFKLFAEKSGIDRTTLILMMEGCACDLIFSCVAIPLRILNIFTGEGALFHKENFGCWFYLFTLAVSYANSWILFCLAITRVVAIFAPHKYDGWMRNSTTVRWLLYVMPWLIGFSTHVIYGPWLYYFTAGIDTASGGLCIYARLSNSPLDIAHILSQSWAALFLQTIAPLLLSGMLYGAIFMKLIFQKSAIHPAASNATAVVNIQVGFMLVLFRALCVVKRV